MSAFDPIPDLERLGYTPREAGFVALVAAHSSFFLRRHFNHYLHKKRRWRTGAQFLDQSPQEEARSATPF